MPRTPTPVIRNVQDLERPVKNLEFVHFTAEQWENATRGLTAKRGKLGRGSAIECIPTIKSGWLLAPHCSGGPNQICVREMILEDGRLVFKCSCVKVGGSPPAEPNCRLAIVRVPVPRITCVRVGCAGTCSLGLLSVGVRFFLHCECA